MISRHDGYSDMASPSYLRCRHQRCPAPRYPEPAVHFDDRYWAPHLSWPLQPINPADTSVTAYLLPVGDRGGWQFRSALLEHSHRILIRESMNGTVNEGENLPKWQVLILKCCSWEENNFTVAFVTTEALACGGVAISLRKCQLSPTFPTFTGFGYKPDPLTSLLACLLILHWTFFKKSS
jgi:hypothetical protein